MPEHKNFTFFQPKIAEGTISSQNFIDENISVVDAVASLEKMNRRGDFLAAHDSNNIPEDAMRGPGNHFQGIQRLRTPDYLVLSGGFKKASAAYLFVVKMESRTNCEIWKSNLSTENIPALTDRTILTIHINDGSSLMTQLGTKPEHFHAGGICLLGDLLAVPLEGEKDKNKSSVILFYNMKNPENPELLKFSIPREGFAAGSIAMTKLKTGPYLLGVHHTPVNGDRCIDFYIFDRKDMDNGTFRKCPSWNVKNIKAVPGEKADFSDYQNIEFVCEGSGTLYIIGMHNNKNWTSLWLGGEFVDLFRVDLETDNLATVTGGSFAVKLVTKVKKQKLESNKDKFNLDAGSGIYVSPKGAMLMYACHHFLKKEGHIRFSEFSPTNS